MKFLKIVLLLSISFNGVAQNRNSIWCFGDSAGIDFRNINNPVPIFSSMDGRGSCTSISDSIGNLLFYSNTYTPLLATYVWNSLNDTMNNGILLGGGMYNELQIIPFPDGQNKYYLFYTGAAGLLDGLFYAIIDMNLNGGLGEIITSFQQINSNRIADCLQAVKHGNGRDWWLITKLSDINATTNNRFIEYLITPNGISQAITYDFGNATDLDFQKIIFNNSYTKIMDINLLGYMSEFNFDRCSGVISNPNTLYSEQTSVPLTRLFWEGSYSPNDSVFYVTTNRYSGLITSYLLQYNLTSANISNSCDTLDSSLQPIGPGAVRLAPDNKIYYSRAYEILNHNSFPYPDSTRNYINENLSVINYPDSVGSACDFQPFSFYLGGKRTYYGLPNNPNYQLGKLVGSICDTLTVGLNSIAGENASEIFVFYHPSHQTTVITAKGLTGKKYTISIYDIIGHLIFKEEGDLNSEYFTKDVNMQNFAKGMYIVNLQTEKENLVKKFLRE